MLAIVEFATMLSIKLFAGIFEQWLERYLMKRQLYKIFFARKIMWPRNLPFSKSWTFIGGFFLIFSENTVADCDCGPTYCVDTPEYQRVLVQKKAAAEAAGFPGRLIGLYDSLDRCEASVTTSPDGFNILRETKEGDISIDEWTAENERNDAKLVKTGDLTACYVILSRHAFACCNGTSFDQRPDYNQHLDLNTDGTLPCSE